MNLGYLFSRLSITASKLSSGTHAAWSISTTQRAFISSTPCMYAEPLKKKKRLDPQVLKARDDRKKRKLEKMIKRMEKFSMPLKPIEETIVPLALKDGIELRKRPSPSLTIEEQERRVLLMKSWTRFRVKEHLADIQMLDRIVYSQQRAMDELRQESEDLYLAALQIDPNLLSVEIKGPVVTPPQQDYDSPDGDYHDVSFKWG